MSPIYSYFCSKCNKRNEAFRSVEGRDKGPACRECGHTMKRVAFPKETPAGPNHRNSVPDPFRKV